MVLQKTRVKKRNVTNKRGRKQNKRSGKRKTTRKYLVKKKRNKRRLRRRIELSAVQRAGSTSISVLNKSVKESNKTTNVDNLFNPDYFLTKGFTQDKHKDEIFLNNAEGTVFKSYRGDTRQYIDLFNFMKQYPHGPFTQLKEIVNFTDKTFIGTELVNTMSRQEMIDSNYEMMPLLTLQDIGNNTYLMCPCLYDYLLAYAFCLNLNILVTDSLNNIDNRGYKFSENKVSYEFNFDDSWDLNELSQILDDMGGNLVIGSYIIEPLLQNKVENGGKIMYVQSVLFDYDDWKIECNYSKDMFCKNKCVKVLSYLREMNMITLNKK
jgi:hypothetical protein